MLAGRSLCVSRRSDRTLFLGKYVEKIVACARCAEFSLCLIALFSGVQTIVKLAPAVAQASTFSCSFTPSGKDYSSQDLTNHDFRADPAGSLVGANFKNAILKGAIFAGQDLTKASFEGADLGPSAKGPADFTQAKLDQTCFVKATMNATDFTFADFTCTDFTGTSLMKAQFGPAQSIAAGADCRTSFRYATIDVNAIDTGNWGKTDFSYTNFQGVSPSTFNLIGKDITGAILVGTRLPNIDMTGANLTDVNLSEAAWSNANLTNVAMNGADATLAKLDFVTLTCARFYYDKGSANDPNAISCKDTPATTKPNAAATLIQINLKHADLTHATLDFAALNGANLTSAVFDHATLRQASLESKGSISTATILSASFKNTIFDNAHIDHVKFNNVHLLGARFANKSTLNGTSFNGSIMPQASFNGATLEDVTFFGSLLQDADFSDSTLKTVPGGGGSGVDFSCSELGGSHFDDAVVTAATFADAAMPGPKDCCPAKKGFQWCGTINSTQTAYGPVIYPPLQTNVTCPNGDQAKCSGAQWRLAPNWTTTACNPNQVPQVLWRRPPCGSPPGDIVHFKDPNLKQCIIDTLPGHPSEVTVATAADMDRVVCPGKGISDLAGLEKFSNLTALDLSANKLTQFSVSFEPATNCGSAKSCLQQLRIGDNDLTLLSLGNLTSLVWLEAPNNKLKSIEGMGQVSIEVLDVSGNQLTELDLPIQDSLTNANLSGNLLNTVLDQFNKNLNRLQNLQYLDLSHNLLSEVGSVKAIATTGSGGGGFLNSLFLACNPKFQCASLDIGGSYPALQSSQCADFNPASGEWVLRETPNCPK